LSSADPKGTQRGEPHHAPHPPRHTRDDQRAGPWPLITLDDYIAESFGYQGLDYGVVQSPSTVTLTQGNTIEEIGSDFRGYVDGVYKRNGVVFACVTARMLIFSEARFQWRQRVNGVPGNLFGTNELARLERPWPNATTGDLLARMLLDVDLCGNAYVARRGGGLRLMRPDWVTIILGSRTRLDRRLTADDLDADVIGYAYHPGGVQAGADPEILLADDVAHFAPLPDPAARFRGMSWITPVVREIQGDSAATSHKLSFFTNAAPQPLDAKVLTPAGWSTMGDMTVGDDVIGSDGRGHRIVGVYPQGEQDVYRVTFSDGAQTECTADHLWTVQNLHDRKLGRSRTLPLSEIVAGGVAYDSGPLKWAVPNVEPVEYDVDLEATPMDPYLLGILLGDGSFRANRRGSNTGTMTCASHVDDAEELIGEITPRLPAGVQIVQRTRGGCTELRFTRMPGTDRANAMATLVRDLDLFDVIGRDKFIPRAYLHATVADRIALLQGLIDSDGGVDKRQGNLVRFTTTSEIMAAQVAELVGSLGGIGTIARNRGRSTITVNVRRLPHWIVPCRLARKVAAYKPNACGGRHRYIKTVEYVGRKPCQCIRVDVADSLYVTDDYILTHNTPNLAIVGKNLTLKQAQAIQDALYARHAGVANAYESLVLGGVDDVKVVGADMRQISFKETQGHGETRICAAARVPAIIAGVSEGLDASTYSNFEQAKKHWADGTIRPLWRNVAASLQTILDVPNAGAELWYDDRDIPFLKDDITARAAVNSQDAGTINTLISAGFNPDDAVDAVTAGICPVAREAYGPRVVPAPGARRAGSHAAPPGERDRSVDARRGRAERSGTSRGVRQAVDARPLAGVADAVS
jgi:hypothetical protein